MKKSPPQSKKAACRGTKRLSQLEFDQSMMRMAILKAKEAFARGDYPIGAVITRGRKIIASAGNRVKTKGDSTKHVELELIQYVVGQTLGNYIPDCTLYSTHEPCPMCSGAAHWARMKRIVFGVGIPDMDKHTNESNRLKWRTLPNRCKEVFRGEVSEYVEYKRCLKLLELS